MQILKLIEDQFKGVNHAEYDLSGNPVIVKGANGTFKTTMGDGYCWLFTDKDYSLKANPNIRPDNLVESEPSVEIIGDIDGKTVSLKKIQKDARNKKQKEQGAPVRIKNVFEVNTVPVSQSAFIDKLKEYGIDVDKFELLTHPQKFTDMKSADCRNILFGMVTEVSDKDIADSMGDCEEVSKLLDNYTIEEIASMQKQSKKKANEMLDSLPDQILGMEKSKIQIDVKSLTEQKDALQTDISNLESILESNPLPGIGDLNEKIAMCENQMRIMASDANSQRIMNLSLARDIQADLKRQKSDLEYNFKTAIGAEGERKARIETLKGEYQSLADSFQKLKAVEFDESSNICKYCGQPLPVDKAEQNRKKFTDEIERQKTAINRHAASIKKQIKELESHPVEAPDHAKIDELSKQIEDKQKEMDSLFVEVDVTGTDKYKMYLAEIQKVREQIADLDAKSMEQQNMRIQISEKRIQMNHISDQIAQSAVNAHIDKKIAEAKEQQKQYAQASANAEKILDQLSRISMKKNEMLTEQVNSHFNGVKFQLFEQLKNGEYKDCCIPLVPTADGEYRDITFSANTAAIVRGQLAIISGLQKFYGQNLPVFLDGAECLDTVNSQIETDFQLIQLRVSDDKDLTIVHDNAE